MKTRTFAWLVIAIVLLLIPVGSFQAEEQAQNPPDMNNMMKLAAPGEHHKHLDLQAGSWEFTSKAWSPMGGDPMEINGTIEAAWILGGRFLEQEISATVMDMPFEGYGIDGYDNLGTQYVGMWMDNMGTAVMHFEGSCEADGKVRTMFAEGPNPMEPDQPMKIKGVTTIVDENNYKYESFVLLPDGNEFKQMELVAKRRQ